MDGGAWYATDHGIAKSRTRLSNFSREVNSIITLVLQTGKPRHREIETYPRGFGLIGRQSGHYILKCILRGLPWRSNG